MRKCQKAHMLDFESSQHFLKSREATYELFLIYDILFFDVSNLTKENHRKSKTI